MINEGRLSYNHTSSPLDKFLSEGSVANMVARRSGIAELRASWCTWIQERAAGQERKALEEESVRTCR